IGEWYVKEGTWVDADTNLVGLETDKATFDVPAPQAGVLKSISKQAGQSAAIGDVIAVFEPGPKAGGSAEPAVAAPSASAAAAPAPAADSSAGHVMPAAARVAAQNQIVPSTLKGSGPAGRVLKEDV